MASEEQYLDDLLKSLMESEQNQQIAEESEPESESEAEVKVEQERKEEPETVEEPIPDADDLDLMELMKQLDMQETDSNMSDLEKPDDLQQMETSDEDMLALLEGLPEVSDESEGEDTAFDQEIAVTREKKKPLRNFFAGLFERLFREEEEEQQETQDASSDKEGASEGNTQVLEEITEKKKKKGKTGRKKGKKSGQEGEQAQEVMVDDLPDEDVKENKKKLKKPRKKKEKKDDLESMLVPTQKVINQKTIMVLVSFCASLTACIVFLSSFLPEYADKKEARQSYYAGDYRKTYENLYNKNLSESDTIIYNRARMVLMLQQKMDTYHYYIKLGKELEALDSLLQGVERYHRLSNRDAGIQSELDAVYAQICDILQNNYDISSTEADEINTYDKIIYSQRLNSIVYGIEFDPSLEEPMEEEEILPTQDVLPEEEEWIDMGDSL